MTKIKPAILVRDIRFWIVLFFFVRLIGISNPPLEAAHNWRQSLTNMIARNFLEVDDNILYPRIDMDGDNSGIIGAEFPIYNYLIYITFKGFGFSHWAGRLINLLVSSFGLYYFFLVVRRHFDGRIAFNATLVLLFSIWFIFSRKIMPDTFSASFAIAALYYLSVYLDRKRLFELLLFFALMSLAALSKIPALVFLSLVVLPLLSKKYDVKIKASIAAASLLSFLLVCLWYFYWVPSLLERFRFQLYFPKGFSEGISEIMPLMPEFFEKFYYSALLSYVAFASFLAGLYLLFISRNKWLIGGFALFTITFLAFIIKTGAVFPMHSYYIIPFVPAMALAAALFLSKLPVRYGSLVLIAIGIESLANQQHDFFIRPTDKYKTGLESIADKVCGKGDLIVVNGGLNPQAIYFIHRKGWTVNNEVIHQPKQIDAYIDKGAKYLFVLRKYDEDMPAGYRMVYSDDNVNVFALTKEK
ncbi:MAG: glycosyltransferase family 39 protein [Bacteroidales bacterium]|nr:glycosyltransferase family 39 protein [Bacteroidales bacterium]